MQYCAVWTLLGLLPRNSFSVLQEQSLVWKSQVGGGGVFASPAVSADSCVVVAATLGGHVTALSVVSWLSALQHFSLDFLGNWGIVEA